MKIRNSIVRTFILIPFSVEEFAFPRNHNHLSQKYPIETGVYNEMNVNVIIGNICKYKPCIM